MESFQDVILQEVTDEAERSFLIGDSFDMKANVLLVVVTFLAAQSAYFLGIVRWPVLYYGQMFSVFLIAACGLLVLVELFPRNYKFFSPSNGAIEGRFSELLTEFGSDGTTALEKIASEKLEWARERAKKNKEINGIKSRLLNRAFWLLTGAVGINLLTLICLAMRPFSGPR